MTQVALKTYTDNLDHILATMALLDLRLAIEVERVRGLMSGRSAGDYPGLFVSENDLDAVLSRTPIIRARGNEGPAVLLGLLRQREAEVAVRTRESLESGVALRLERLRSIYALTDFEVAVLTLCLAPELDEGYETIFSYVQNDVGKRRPTLNLALALFCGSLRDRVDKRNFLASGSPLVSHELVHVGENPHSKNAITLSSFLSADQRAVDYLLGANTLDAELRHIAHLRKPSKTWDDVILDEERKAQAMALPQILADHADSIGAALQLLGPTGSGKKTLAEALCNSLGRSLLIVDAAALLHADAPARRLIALARREALLQEAILYLDNTHVLAREDSKDGAALTALRKALEERPGLVILAGETRWDADGAAQGQNVISFSVPAPGYSERKRLWEESLERHSHSLTDEQTDLLAGKFRLTGAQIGQVVATAQQDARFKPEWESALTVEDLHAAARWHSNQRIGAYARKVHPGYAWDDIVLPADQKAQLREVCGYFVNAGLVYDQWDFQSKASLGKGLNILFAGASGTGKTMAADIMAGELGLDLYKVDLSGVVSKYIGETEKNLDRIFHEAQGSNAIIFFDEADALFGKRSEVRDSHDRYANIEISYLLQKMEEYQGIVILATNFRKNMDDAFVRRMHFAIEFPVPEERDRLEIWKRVYPAKAPLDDGVDLGFAARQFKLTGGNIKNIAVTSAFLAAQDSKRISMKHIMLATRREYQKMGKLLLESEFGPYFGFVKANGQQKGLT